MIHKPTLLRPGMTAIAAVLALSSTPLLAQSADPAPSTDAPVLVTPPPVVPSAAPAITPDAAPQAAAPDTTMRTASTPIVNMPDTAAQDAAAPARAVTHTKTTQIHTATTTPRAAEVTPPAPVAPVKVTSTKTTGAVPNGIAQTSTTSKSVVTPAAAPQSTQTVSDDEMIAGIAGLGLIALAGGAFAYTRRTKRYQQYQDVDVVPEPVAVVPVGPIGAASGIVYADEVYADGPRTELPAGFDLSRFGRHTQAAYRGPTADNPSLSLKRRLKRASFYDQRERMAAEGTAAPLETPVSAPIAVPARAPRRTEHADHIVSRLRPQRSFRPVTA